MWAPMLVGLATKSQRKSVPSSHRLCPRSPTMARAMKAHWHLGYSKKTACGMLAYPTSVSGEFDTPTSNRIDCAIRPKDVTCARCKKVMLLGKWAPNDRSDNG